MSSDERGPNPGHDHDEGKVMEEQQEASEAPQFDDGDSPTTSDGQIRPADVAPKLAPDDVDDAEETTGGAKGDIQTKGQEPHQ